MIAVITSRLPLAAVFATRATSIAIAMVLSIVSRLGVSVTYFIKRGPEALIVKMHIASAIIIILLNKKSFSM